LAVIDLVATLYTGGVHDRRALAAAWQKYSDLTVNERRQKGFELVRSHHQLLTRMFKDDPDGDLLDLDDLRSVWEEFVDALRDATGAAEKEGQGFGTEWTYENLETPILKHNKSFNSLFEELQEVVSSSPGATPEGSTRGIKRVSSNNLLLGIGCSSRENSSRGGSKALQQIRAAQQQGVDAGSVAAKLEKIDSVRERSSMEAER